VTWSGLETSLQTHFCESRSRRFCLNHETVGLGLTLQPIVSNTLTLQISTASIMQSVHCLSNLQEDKKVRKNARKWTNIEWSFVTVQFQLVVLHICGKELLDDQTQLRRGCWVATGLSRWMGCSDPQGSGPGRESINPAKMKLCPGCHNAFASSKLNKLFAVFFCIWMMVDVVLLGSNL